MPLIPEVTMKLEKVKLDNHWAIYRCGKAYIVHNRNLHFEQGHCHVKTLKTANDIVLMCRLNKVPRAWDIRILTSLARVADTDHANKVNELIRAKLHKSKQETKRRKVV